MPWKYPKQLRKLQNHFIISSISEKIIYFRIKPIEPGCPCPACSKFERAYVHHLVRSGEILGAMLMIVVGGRESANTRHLAEVAADHSEPWRDLGVSILHRLVVETIFGRSAGPDEKVTTTYVHLIDEVVQGLKTGEYPVAALVMPATVDHIRQISMEGDRMPQKSTYFYPKLLSGLVINPLE